MSEVPIPASLVPGGQATVTRDECFRRPWLLVDLLRELGDAVRMYTDPRYRVRRYTQLIVWLISDPVRRQLSRVQLHAARSCPIFRQIMERLVEIVLAILLYKVVSREVARLSTGRVQLSLSPRTWAAVPVSLLHNDPDTAAVTRQESP